MPIPRLQDDVLSEIFTHFFQSAPPTTLSHSRTHHRSILSLLLTCKRIRNLALPLFWRNITIHRPSDFVSLFAPKVGLLHAKGKVGVNRRDWIRELRIGQEAVVPYDIAKIDKTFERDGDVDSERGYDFHVNLSPVKLPNLRTLSLAVKKKMAHQGDESDDSFSYLYRRIVDAGDGRDRAGREEDPDLELPEDMEEDEYEYYGTAFAIAEGETTETTMSSSTTSLVETRRSSSPSSLPSELNSTPSIFLWTSSDERPSQGKRILRSIQGSHQP